MRPLLVFYNLQQEVVLDTPLILRQNHQRAKQQRQQLKNQQIFEGKEFSLQFPIVDDVSADNLCFQPISELTECFVDGLLKMAKGKGTGIPAIGKYIRVKIIDPGYFMGSIMCLVEDNKGQVINLALHNFVSLGDNVGEIAALMVNGQELVIKQPYLQVRNWEVVAISMIFPYICTLKHTHTFTLTFGNRSVAMVL